MPRICRFDGAKKIDLFYREHAASKANRTPNAAVSGRPTPSSTYDRQSGPESIPLPPSTSFSYTSPSIREPGTPTSPTVPSAVGLGFGLDGSPGSSPPVDSPQRPAFLRPSSSTSSPSQSRASGRVSPTPSLTALGRAIANISVAVPLSSHYSPAAASTSNPSLAITTPPRFTQSVSPSPSPALLHDVRLEEQPRSPAATPIVHSSDAPPAATPAAVAMPKSGPSKGPATRSRSQSALARVYEGLQGEHPSVPSSRSSSFGTAGSTRPPLPFPRPLSLANLRGRARSESTTSALSSTSSARPAASIASDSTTSRAGSGAASPPTISRSGSVPLEGALASLMAAEARRDEADAAKPSKLTKKGKGKAQLVEASVKDADPRLRKGSTESSQSTGSRVARALGLGSAKLKKKKTKE